ncbi:hypothetical protein BN7_2681 [Wickerhamomyces ciferrii]|uniref:FCP1 homology domain-containing protein n=1 Tax=Wickerhamomyces ciferrii (strain ATCC 14091 / BCRC 22168 / CBS 111 / JCM 3599 / NBRC 0793 / NRRL Y-1031 F-60-10) TaxID=1206466 RepID=K0KP16_WICCF|nr:uncharacterized protein BN7_2681 [Wickerhamomyces ciferrii]CCH43134.1 hypothetical protein BN7_2681 [Wickerhamomyces ciferrii]
MEQVIKSIFCCAGGDSNSNNQQDSIAKSTNRNYNSSQINSNNQSSKNSSTNNNKTNNNNKSTQPKNQNNNSMNQQNTSHNNHNHHHHQRNIQNNDKTDVNVYEATDSTLDTNEDKRQRNVSQNNNQDDGKNEQESSIDLGHESDIDMNENETLDDFFDLTKIQPGQAHASTGFLLEKIEPKFKGKKCLVLDLDETLVHSSFKVLRQCDFIIPVDIDNQIHNVFVIKRPGVDEFLRRVGELYEVVVFTASVSRYGDPLLDELDIHKSIHHRLFRDSCYNYQGNYIKNLSQIGRPLGDLIILDNSPASYIFHPQHAIPISSWFSDAHDNELLDIIPFLEDLAKDNVEDVGLVLDINL